jgi:accessory gene regulator protein AgrB
MNIFGPVGEAAHGGHSSPTFDLIVGFAVLALTWVSYLRKEERQKTSVWIAIGITAICAVFIYAGINELLR